MRNHIRLLAFFGVLALGALVAGCCTLAHGSKQVVPIDSDPPGANVQIDDAATATTPARVKLLRRRDHTVTISKPGYESQTVPVRRAPDAWLAGNAITCGAGCVVDAPTGAAYTLSPERVSVTLVPLVPTGQDTPRPEAPGVPYTCPTHTDVVQASPGRCPKCGMELRR